MIVIVLFQNEGKIDKFDSWDNCLFFLVMSIELRREILIMLIYWVLVIIHYFNHFLYEIVDLKWSNIYFIDLISHNIHIFLLLLIILQLNYNEK
jgi:hypothetical protein